MYHIGRPYFRVYFCCAIGFADQSGQYLFRQIKAAILLNTIKYNWMNTIVQLNRQELRAELLSVFSEFYDGLKSSLEIEGEVLLEPDVVTKTLSVSDTTLWRWAKAGYLTPIYVGGTKRYRKSDVERIMEGK